MNDPDNLISLDLSKFSRADIAKMEQVGEKLRLMRRWFRYDIGESGGSIEARLYSGDRGPAQYVLYRIVRGRDGAYELYKGNAETPSAQGRTIDAVIDALPDDFYYTNYSRKG